MKKFFTTCLRDCYDTCLIETIYDRKEIKEINGYEAHPVTSGFLCPKGNKLLKYLNHHTRIKQPMAGEFLNWKNVSWDEAVKKIVDAINTHPDKVGFYSYYGSSGLITKNFPERFFRKLGAIGFESAICDRNGREVLAKMNYDSYQIYPEDIEKHKLVVIWGGNPKWSSLHHWFLILKHKLKIIGIDVIKTVSLKDAYQILRPKPSTDWFVAYAIAKILIEEDLIDKEYIKENVEDYEFIKNWILDNISIEETIARSGVTYEQMKKFITNLQKFKPAYFYIGYGIQRQKNGGEIVRAIATLAALTGSKIFFSRMVKNKKASDYIKGKELGKLKRYNQMLLPEIIEKGKIKVLFIFNANPVSTSPNSNRIKEALLKKDVFVVVSDIFFTDTAKLANVILPAPTFFEYFDIAKSFFHNYIQINQKVIEPMYESKSNYEQFKILAKAVGFDDDALFESEEEIAQNYLSFYNLSFDELKEKGLLEISIREKKKGKIKFKINLKNAPQTPFYEEDNTPQGYLRLISPVHRDLTSSQYFRITTNFLPDRAFLNSTEAKNHRIRSGDRVKVYNERGSAEMIAEVKNEVPPGVLLIYKAPWESLTGYSPNLFTEDKPHPIYKGSQFHSTFVKIKKIKED